MQIGDIAGEGIAGGGIAGGWKPPAGNKKPAGRV